MREKIIAYFKGTMDKKDFSKIFIPNILIFLICCIISQILFRNYDINPPDSYSIMRYRISQQGYLDRNPVGGWFFIISSGITGILLIGYYMYIFQRIKPTTTILTKIMLYCGILGSIGFSMVGFFPMGNGIIDDIHGLGSDMAFYGMGLAAFISFLIMIRKMQLKEVWPKLKEFIFVYGFSILVGSLILVFDNGPLQQWLGMFTLLTWIIGLFIISPKSRQCF
jgi:hypothetical protein